MATTGPDNLTHPDLLALRAAMQDDDQDIISLLGGDAKGVAKGLIDVAFWAFAVLSGSDYDSFELAVQHISTTDLTLVLFSFALTADLVRAREVHNLFLVGQIVSELDRRAEWTGEI